MVAKTFYKQPIRIAILGARGIGQVHARIFHELGAEICAVLGSSDESATDAAQGLKGLLGIEPQPFSCLSALIDIAHPDAVSVCTAPHLHFEQIMTAFDHNLPVFCEKPLFWHHPIQQSEVQQKLANLEKHHNRRLFVNTSNATFIEHVIEMLGKPDLIDTFSFHFHTQGSYTGRDIGLDLLPHGLSLLLTLFNSVEVKDLTEQVDEHRYDCVFMSGQCQVKFSFQELRGGEKLLAFDINGRTFTRIQQGIGATYRVFLQDSETRVRFEVPDPFQVYIKRFLDYSHSDMVAREDAFEEAAMNLRLMANILLGDAIKTK